MKLSKLNSRFGNKGFVFSMDATFALIIVVFILTMANIYLILGNQATSIDVQTNKYGDDIIKILDEQGTLQTLNQATINTALQTLVPVNYDVSISVKCKRYPSGTEETITAGSSVPTDKDVFSGTRIFIITNADTTQEKYCSSRYWIWSK